LHNLSNNQNFAQYGCGYDMLLKSTRQMTRHTNNVIKNRTMCKDLILQRTNPALSPHE
jgi:hypothetical protein